MLIFLVDAFTETRFEGNPAGVVLLDSGDSISAEEKQKMAAEIKASETAFVSTSNVADYKVEFFTPKAQIDFCGHATIAVFHTLARIGKLKFSDGRIYTSEETDAGIVAIAIEQQAGGRIVVEMTQRKPRFADCQWSPAEVARALGIGEDELDPAYPIKLANTGNWHLVVGVKSRAVLDAIEYDAHLLAQILSQASASTAHVFWALNETTIHARNFCPHIGIPEDPATGAAAGAFCAYLSQISSRKGDNLQIQILQGERMGRPSRIAAAFFPETGEVKVTGSAVMSFMLVDPELP
jgi:PhzF family phenazine biosynthesis protein